jgi:hypothetical protein
MIAVGDYVSQLHLSQKASNRAFEVVVAQPKPSSPPASDFLEMMSFSRHDGFGRFATAASSNGASLPWWAGTPHQLLYGEPPCRESRFQVVPGSQALLEPQVPPKAVQQEREFPDVVKFSMAHGEDVSVNLSQEHGTD